VVFGFADKSGITRMLTPIRCMMTHKAFAPAARRAGLFDSKVAQIQRDRK
jgi:hypothetical protein